MFLTIDKWNILWWFLIYASIKDVCHLNNIFIRSKKFSAVLVWGEKRYIQCVCDDDDLFWLWIISSKCLQEQTECVQRILLHDNSLTTCVIICAYCANQIQSEKFFFICSWLANYSLGCFASFGSHYVVIMIFCFLRLLGFASIELIQW